MVFFLFKLYFQIVKLQARLFILFAYFSRCIQFSLFSFSIVWNGMYFIVMKKKEKKKHFNHSKEMKILNFYFRIHFIFQRYQLQIECVEKIAEKQNRNIELWKFIRI